MNVELLRVKARIGFDENRLANHLFHLLQPLRARRLQLFDDLGIDAQHHVAAVEMLLHLAHLDVDVVADSHRRLDHACTRADVAGRRQSALQRLLDALASNRNQTKIVELKNLRWSAVVLQLFFQRSHDAIAILALIHVDEVDDDDAAKIAQTNLANNLRNRIEIGLDDRVLEARRLADELAGVDVDRDQSLGLVDDDRATGLSATPWSAEPC